VLPNVALSIWAMWGLRRVLDLDRPRTGALIATLALAAVFHTGHVQMAANVWLAVWLWGLGMAALHGVLRRRLVWLLGIACAALLMAMPSLLPTALILTDAGRMSAPVTAGSGFRPFAMLGSLLPVIRGSDGALVHPVIVTTFVAAWVVPGLVLGAGVVLQRKLHDLSPLARTFLLTLLVALICIWLNFGPAGGLYSALHALPIWSHFRVPYKYFERAVPLLALAGALGLELAARRAPPRGYALVLLLLTLVAGVLWMVLPASEPLVWLAGSSALLTLLVLAILPTRGITGLLVPLCILQSVAVIAITHAPHRSKSYTFDRRPDARLPLSDVRRRVLPLSEGPSDHPYTRPLALFYAPTLDGYASASGHRFALTSRRLGAILPASVAGVPAANRLTTLLNSNFIRIANVGHFVVAAADTATLRTVETTFPGARITRTARARIVHVDSAQPLAFFATEQRPGNTAVTHEILFTSAPIHAAGIEGDARRRPLPPAQVLDLRSERDRFDARLHAPEGGLLVFSTAYSTEWLARANGTLQPVVPVNELFAGVWVPAGTEEVALFIRRWPLLLGLLAAALGAALCYLLLRAMARAPGAQRTKRAPLS
jgi:hypothetical protein